MARRHTYDESEINFHNIDLHAAKVPMDKISSKDDLMQYLAEPIDQEDINRNIYLARAFIGFLNTINIDRRSRKYNVSWTVQQIIYDNPTVSFKTLCRNAGIEVEVITGMAKDSNYQAGVRETGLVHESQWCAFKSNDTWHLVHPLWAIDSLYGFAYGGDMLEGDGQMNVQARLKCQGQTIHAFNDFWFCTMPEIFIHHCFPDNAEWQLLLEPYKTLDEFFTLPFLQQGYYEAALKLLSEGTCTLYSVNGACIISFSADKTVSKNLEFSYTLTLLSGDKSRVNWSDLCQLVMFIPSENTYTFKINLPVEGTYSFEIMVIADDIVTNASCADFRIECNKASTNCRKVPLKVGMKGYGYGNEAKKAGLKHPSERSPVLVLKPTDVELGSDFVNETINFDIDSDRVDEVQYTSDIIGDIDKKQVHTKTSVDKKRGKLTVKVEAPEGAEFTLAIKAKERNSEAEFKIVLNYLLSTDPVEKELCLKHEQLAKQRKREITKEEKLASKTKRKTKLIMEINDLRKHVSTMRDNTDP